MDTENINTVTMTGLLLGKYGNAVDVLKYSEMDPSRPKDNELLIEVKSVGLNPIDLKLASGELRAILPSILQKPKLGFDISGIVRAVGSDITDFAVGDRVYARLPLHQGSGFAPFVVAKADHVSPMPDNLDFEQAAAVPLAGLTSLQALTVHAGAKGGQNLLIDSGSGGVGTLAIQFAKSLGLHVTAVTSHRNESMVQFLGADQVICYDLESFVKNGAGYDIVFNMIGGLNPIKSILATKRGGVVVSIGGPPDVRFVPKLKMDVIRKLLLLPLFGLTSLPLLVFARARGVRYHRFLTESNGRQLRYMAGLIEAGKINPVIDRTYPLADYKKALEYLASNRVRGKLILNITH
jgi:alcohol dehydrogenase